MPTDLAQHIAQLRVVDTHEHQRKEPDWLDAGPRDVLADLFASYEVGDLVCAGAEAETIRRLQDPDAAGLEQRWAAVAPFFERIRFTGYGEGVRLHARLIYGIEEITPAALRAAQPKLDALRRPGQRLRLLRDVARLDHIQTDDFVWACLPDASGPDFFFYDLSWRSFCQGQLDLPALHAETRVTVGNLASLRQAMEALFDKYGPQAIAVKSQHAYTRTLAWRERDDSDADRALRAVLRDGERAGEEARLCLGDWCIARAAELAERYRLPFKIHTGYYAGTGYMHTARIRAGQLDGLLRRYPRTRFVLMHIAYPYDAELLALVKHFPNAWADLCWAWSIDPRTTGEFVRRFIHAVPTHKLLGFGGDTTWPTKAVAYAAQMRRWLTHALQNEVDDGELSEAAAIALASRFLRDNQFELFEVESRRAAARQAVAVAEPALAAR